LEWFYSHGKTGQNLNIGTMFKTLLAEEEIAILKNHYFKMCIGFAAQTNTDR